jgi:hypothetical protein
VHQRVASASVRPSAGEEQSLARLQRGDARGPRLEHRAERTSASIFAARATCARNLTADARGTVEVDQAAANRCEISIVEKIEAGATRGCTIDGVGRLRSIRRTV